MKKIITILLITVMLLSSVAVADTVKYKDVPEGAWYEKYVYKLSEKGIIKDVQMEALNQNTTPQEQKHHP